MARIAEIAGKFTVKSDPRAVATARQNYNDILKENQRYKERLVRDNAGRRTAELNAERKFTNEMIKENRARAAVMLSGSGPARPQMPGFNRVTSIADIRGGMMSAASGKSGRGGGGGNAVTNRSMGMLMFGQFADDLQYVAEQGLRPVINNLAPLIMGLGGSAGLAGALTIVTIAIDQGVKAWNRWIGATDLAKNNAAALEQRTQFLAEALHAAAEAGQESGQFQLDALKRQEAGRGSQERYDTRALQLIDLQKEQAMADAERLEGAKRLRAEQEASFAAEQKGAELKLKHTTERLERDTEALGATRADLASLQAELDALEARKRTTNTPESDARRIEFLKGKIPKVKATADALDTRAGGLLQEQMDLQQFLQTILPARKAIETRKVVEAEMEEMKAALSGLFSKVGDAVKQFGSGIADTFRRANEVYKQNQARGKTETAVRVSELRAAGKTKQADALEKESIIASRTEQLMSGPEKYTREEASALANREYAVQHPKNVGKIHGAKSPNLRAGEFHSMGNPNTDGGMQSQAEGLGLRDPFGQLERFKQHGKHANVEERLNQGKHQRPSAANGGPQNIDRATGQRWVNELKKAVEDAGKLPAADQTKPAATR